MPDPAPPNPSAPDPPPRDPWLIARLFDLSFSRFVSLSLIRIVYVLLMIAGLASLAFAVTFLFRLGHGDTFVAGLLLLVLAPFAYLAYLLVLRLLCETLLVVFAMAEDMEEIRATLKAMHERNQTLPPS